MATFPNPGDLFQGRYRVDALIGTGGFARVYKAHQEDLGRDVALKILTPTGAEQSKGSTYSEKLAERFEQEAKLVSRLRDPHTITMYDYGRTDDGMMYMVFEYIHGDALSNLTAAGPQEPDRVMKILKQALLSLQEAHAFGVMHRDIKPGNIMVYEHIGRTDQVKVLDFGIAKVAKSTTDLSSTAPVDLTADGALVGTPRYMSPEQIRGEQLSGQSDIYSLGLVGYELLVGEKAIASNSSVTIIGRQLDPRSFYLPADHQIPYGVRYVIDRMLAKDRDARYASAAAVLADVERYREIEPSADVSGIDPTLQSAEREWRPSTPTPRPSRSDSGRLVVPAASSADGPAIRAQSGPPSWMIGVAILLAAMGLAGAVFVFSRGGEETNGAAVPAPTQMTIATRPAGLDIEVNGRSVGKSPVVLSTEDLYFPAIVMARLDPLHERKVELAAAAPSVTVDFTDVVAQQATLAAAAEGKDPDVGTPASAEAPNAARPDETEPAKPAPPPKLKTPPARPKPKPKPKPRKPVDPRPKPDVKPKPPKPKPDPLPTFVPMDKHE